MSYERLDWDSEFFGIPIGFIPTQPTYPGHLGQAVEAADRDGVRCLYLLVGIEQHGRIQAALDVGFRPYDVRVELDRTIDPAEATMGDHVRRAGVEDVDALEDIARKAFCATRFFTDPGFSRERSSELYAVWVRRGLETFPERLTFMVDPGVGFITVGLNCSDGVGTIELLGVTGAASRTGVGRSLLDAAHAAFSDAGLTRATVVTQGHNVAAQRLYQSKGYRTARLAVWLHRWAVAD